jgi:CheY-like chemotaxis protein
LVDDERVVRTVAEGVLKHAGFETLTASDGVEGVEMVRSRGDEIALVLLDLTMPRMSGSDTLRIIREIRPDIPVVICSGYLLDLDEFSDQVGTRPEGVIQKPYPVAELPEIVRRTIDTGTERIPGRDEVVGGEDGLALRS